MSTSLIDPGRTHVATWHVEIDLFESGLETTARARLLSQAARPLEARGHAHRNLHDVPVPEIGEEVAAARALRALANRLLDVASDDIGDIEGHEVILTH